MRHALTRPLQREHHRSPGPSLAPSCVVSGVSSTTTRCDSLGTALDFGCGLIPGQASAAIDLPTGAVGSPQSPGRPSLHAAPSTPERFRAAPESKARTAAFAQLTQARPARSLTGLSFDAAGFNFLTACSFVPPPFGSASQRLPEISLPGSSGGLPGPDSHRLVASPCWAVRELLKLGITGSRYPWVRLNTSLASPVAASPSFRMVAPQRLHLNSDWPQAAPTRTGRLAGQSTTLAITYFRRPLWRRLRTPDQREASLQGDLDRLHPPESGRAPSRRRG